MLRSAAIWIAASQPAAVLVWGVVGRKLLHRTIALHFSQQEEL
jgi:hypothetical protein